MVKVLLLGLATVSIFVVLWVAFFLAYRWFGVGQKVQPAPISPVRTSGTGV